MLSSKGKNVNANRKSRFLTLFYCKNVFVCVNFQLFVRMHFYLSSHLTFFKKFFNLLFYLLSGV